MDVCPGSEAVQGKQKIASRVTGQRTLTRVDDDKKRSGMEIRKKPDAPD